MRDEIDTPEQPAEPGSAEASPAADATAAEAPATPTEPEPASTESAPEPTNQVVEGRWTPTLMPDDVTRIEFVRDFVHGVPYAVDAVNAAKAGG